MSHKVEHISNNEMMHETKFHICVLIVAKSGRRESRYISNFPLVVVLSGSLQLRSQNLCIAPEIKITSQAKVSFQADICEETQGKKIK